MPTLPLTAFLLRRGVDPVTAWTTASAAEPELLRWANGQAEPLNPAGPPPAPGDFVVAILRRAVPPPAWQEFISAALDRPGFGEEQQALGAVVFCAVADPAVESGRPVRWLAWTFGVGSQALRRSGLDPRFGLMVVLNQLTAPLLAEPADGPARSRRSPQLRELRYRTTAPYVQQTGHRAARDIPVDGFRIDRSSDLIATVGGRGAALTTSAMLGGRSLRFRAELTSLGDLAEFAATAVASASGTEYQEAFNWIDNIQPIYDQDLVAELRGQLVAELTADPGLPTVDVIWPDDLIEAGTDRSIRYVLFPRERGVGPGRTELASGEVADLLRLLARDDNPGAGLDAELRFLDESAERVGTATVLDCLSATLSRGEEEFIAYDGDFYRVSKSFVDRIDAEARAIAPSALAFPRYSGQTEPEYNAMVGREYSDEFVELDRALIVLPGETGIEACDLVAASGALVHVKRKGKSSVLSHLFLQAGNSCELLRRSADARDQLVTLIRNRARNDRIVGSIAAAQLTAEREREQVEVAFAFLGDWRNRTITNLPLFSRISLVTQARRVSNLGYRPTVALISNR